MKRTILKLTGIATVLTGLMVLPTQVQASNPHCPPGYEKVWVPPAYNTVCNKVWCEPVYETVCKKVWCEPVYDTVCKKVWCEPVTCHKPCVTYDHCGKAITTYRTVVMSPGHYKMVHERVVVTPGHYNTVHQRVLVTPGHYDTVHQQVQVRAGHWSFRKTY
jgi:hypothetical protein